MKKYLSPLMGITLVLALAVSVQAKSVDNPSNANGLAHPGNSSQLHLYEKDPSDWTVVEDGAWGQMRFDSEDVVLNGHGLEPGVEYTLVNYEGWPDVQVLGSAVANNGGNVHVRAEMPDELVEEVVDEGAKFWLVLSEDLDGDSFNAWNPTEYLFEYDTVSVPLE